MSNGDESMSPAEFEQALRAKGEYYHIHHPFHRAMYAGQATREQIQGWVANRFYYQACIPVKDAAIMANCPDREVRREWIQRLLDHDGAPEFAASHHRAADTEAQPERRCDHEVGLVEGGVQLGRLAREAEPAAEAVIRVA